MGGFFAATHFLPVRLLENAEQPNTSLEAAACTRGVPRVSTTAWKICQPVRNGPRRVHRERDRFDSNTKSPRFVPAQTITRSGMWSWNLRRGSYPRRKKTRGPGRDRIHEDLAGPSSLVHERPRGSGGP
jgi:hypothetical protein